jgi:hypothetical protein
VTASSEYDGQVTAIRTTLLTVEGIGRVHDRPRLGDFRERWVVELAGVPEIRAWEIQTGNTRTVRREQGRRHRYREWQVNGMVGLADLPLEDSENPTGDSNLDASWHTINRLAGEAADAVDAAREAWVAAELFIETEPTETAEPTVIQIGGGPICWGTTLTIRGYTILTP